MNTRHQDEANHSRTECILQFEHEGECQFYTPAEPEIRPTSTAQDDVDADRASEYHHYPSRRSVLLRAEEMINGQRQKDYGSPLKSFTRLAALWWAYIITRPDPNAPLSPEDAGCMALLMKISRYQNGYHDDSVVDMAGYAGCLELVQREREGLL